MPKPKETRIGELPPQYIFVLNPYPHERFSRCPNCRQPTRLRKLPLFIHVDPMQPIVLNKTCRYCPACDLLIAHRDELEEILSRMFGEEVGDPGRQFLVLGTVERRAWREGVKRPIDLSDMLGHMRDFREVRAVHVEPGGWRPMAPPNTAEERRQR